MPVNDGGPAFPAKRMEQAAPVGGRVPLPVEVDYPGCSVRDVFAAFALMGILSRLENVAVMGTIANARKKGGSETIAEGCYGFADAMLAARGKEPPSA